jgi:Ribonuclease G/E
VTFQNIDREHRYSQGEFVRCQNCKGKGHVMYCPPVIFLPVLGWAMALLERNSPQGITRECCGTCDGKGFVKIDE